MCIQRVSAKIGKRFHKEIENIKDERLRNGKSKDRPSTHKISNLIVKHKHWKEIKKDIINLEQEEFDKNAK